MEGKEMSSSRQRGGLIVFQASVGTLANMIYQSYETQIPSEECLNFIPFNKCN